MMLNKRDLITKIDGIINRYYYLGRTSKYNHDVEVLETLLPTQISRLLTNCTRNDKINRVLLTKALGKLKN